MPALPHGLAHQQQRARKIARAGHSDFKSDFPKPTAQPPAFCRCQGLLWLRRGLWFDLVRRWSVKYFPLLFARTDCCRAVGPASPPPPPQSPRDRKRKSPTAGAADGFATWGGGAGKAMRLWRPVRADAALLLRDHWRTTSETAADQQTLGVGCTRCACARCPAAHLGI